MKHLILFLLSTTMFAQTGSSISDSSTVKKPFSSGDVEISFVGGYARTTYETTYSYLYPNPHESTSKSSANVIDLGGVIGFYVAEGFSIEPEFKFSYLFGESGNSDFIYSLIGNLSYSYLLPESKVALFIRCGYGVANGVPLLPPNNVIYKESSDKTSRIFNLGIGTKNFLTENILLRTELGYTSYSYSNDQKNYGVTGYKRNYSFVKVLVGLSFLL
ncbi:MAG: hypothetical protein M1495_12070 [Bacteroidetes bacterium]|nr:hypothetical protein [Bacteroidota bacterium]